MSLGSAISLSLGTLGGLLAWAWHSDTGSRWLLNGLPGLRVEQLRGSLGSGSLQAGSVELTLGADHLRLDNLQWQDLQWHWHPRAGAWAGLSVGQISAQRVTWRSGPSRPSSPAPTDLRLPLDIQLPSIRIASLQVDDLPALTDTRAALTLGDEQGRSHRLQIDHARSDRFLASGQLSLESTAPLAVHGQWALSSMEADGRSGPAWQASITAAGSLAQIELRSHLSGSATSSPGQGRLRQPPTTRVQAELQATVLPFAAWPLGQLRLQTRALDLASLDSRAPSTRLDLQATLDTHGSGQPARAELSLRNQQAGRWDQRRLPIRRLEAHLSGAPSPLNRLDLDQLQVEWGSAEQSAGQWNGTGYLLLRTGLDGVPRPEQGKVELQWLRWQLRELDARLPALSLSGPVGGSLAASQWSVLARLASPMPGGDAGVGTGTPPVTVVVDGRASLQQLKLRELSLQSPNSSLRISGQVERSAQADWQWQLSAEAQAFNSHHWWPAELLPTYRPWAPALTGHLDSQGSVPDAALNQASDLLSAWRGHVNLQVPEAQLAGRPVSGQLNWQSGESSQTVHGQWKVDDALASLDWQRAPRSHAETAGPEQAQLTVDIPRLESLNPWLELLGIRPATGELTVHAKMDTRAPLWTDWHWQADGHATGLHLGDFRVLEAQWQAAGGLNLEAALSASLQADQLHIGPTRLDQIQAQLGGSLARHGFRFQAHSPIRPPAWLERLVGHPAGHLLQTHLSGQGQLDTSLPDGSWQWSGQQMALSLGSLSPDLGARRLSPASSPEVAARPWLSAQGLSTTLRWPHNSGLPSVHLAPGTLNLRDARLSWDAALYQPNAGPDQASVSLAGELQPVSLAPWLGRLQPDTIWGGDLQIGARFGLRRQAGRWDTDLLVERRSGDLSVDEDGRLATSRRQALGLHTLRLALGSHQGRWQLSQALAGDYLGTLNTLVQADDPGQFLWPTTDAALKGEVSLKVANLGAWGTWLPAGWRLGGQLDGQVRFGGRWGAPEVVGSLDGRQLSVRNTLLGVAFQDGELRLALDGPRARLEQFRLRAGDGQLTATGHAELGAQPQATLDFKAARFKVQQRIDRQLALSGTARLLLDPNTVGLTGDLRVDEGLIDISRGDAPSLADDVVVLDSSAPQANTDPGRAETRPSGGPQRLRQLAVNLDLGTQLRLKGLGIDTGLQGTLRFAQARGPLDVQGPVSTAGGTYAAYGQKLSVDRGVILFTGPLNDPRLDIYAIRPDIDARVGVAITGTALNPRVRLASDTDMTDTERLSWLVMGRAPEGLGQADTALLQRAALALLTTDGRSPTNGLLDTIGLTDFGLRQATDSNNVQTTVVSVGKQLSRRWYVGYERSVNATAGSWQLIYRVAQRFTLRAQSGADSALDGIWVWRWE